MVADAWRGGMGQAVAQVLRGPPPLGLRLRCPIEPLEYPPADQCSRRLTELLGERPKLFEPGYRDAHGVDLRGVGRRSSTALASQRRNVPALLIVCSCFRLHRFSGQSLPYVVTHCSSS